MPWGKIGIVSAERARGEPHHAAFGWFTRGDEAVAHFDGQFRGAGREQKEPRASQAADDVPRVGGQGSGSNGSDQAPGFVAPASVRFAAIETAQTVADAGEAGVKSAIELVAFGCHGV